MSRPSPMRPMVEKRKRYMNIRLEELRSVSRLRQSVKKSMRQVALAGVMYSKVCVVLTLYTTRRLLSSTLP